jgi:predicted Zn-ribbon and HTH transcriptional regulator
MQQQTETVNRQVELHCLRCDHSWPSLKEPVRCPKCRSKRWRFRPVVLVCTRCGHGDNPDDPWEQKTDKLPEVCPRCKTYLWQRKRMSKRARREYNRDRLKEYWQRRRNLGGIRQV